MPTYSYKGYDFDVDHEPTPAEFAQMSAHVDSLPPKTGNATNNKSSTWDGTGNPLIDTAIDVPAGIGEFLTTSAAKAFTGLGAKVAGGVAGMLDSNSTAAKKSEEYQKIVDEHTKALDPETFTGKRLNDWLEHGLTFLGDAAQNPDNIKAGLRNIPGMPPELANNIELGGVASTAVQMIPDLLMLAGGRGLVKGAKDTAKGLAKQSEDKASVSKASSLEAEMLAKAKEAETVVPPANPVVANMVKESPMDRMTRDLGAEPAVVPAPPSVMGRMASDLERGVPDASRMEHLDQIDKSIADRQAALEQDVKTKAALEQGAAERARQENAPTYSAEHLAEMERVKQEGIAEAARKQAELEANQRLVDAAKEKAATAEQHARAEAAQRMLDERKVALELEVKKQATLDFNAAERARQENAGPSIPTQVDNHPFVKAAENRVTKQAEIITKIQMALEAGKPVGTQLVRAMRDLKGLEDKAATVRNNVGESLSKGALPKPPPKVASRRSQRGFILVPGRKAQALDVIKKIKPLEEALPEHTTVARTPEEVASIAAKAADVDIGANRFLQVKNAIERQFTKGFLYEKSKTNNPIIKYTYDKISEAVDSARKITHNLLQKDLLPKLRELSNREMIELHQAMHSAMSGKYELSREVLGKHGFSEKQIATWESFQKSFDTSFSNINTALKAAGKQPITKYTSYMAGMATGDFRTPIYKKLPSGEPSIVGFIGSNVSWMRDTRVKNFLKDHPEYTAGDGTFHGRGVGRGDNGQALVQALNLLSENNPAIAVFSKELAEHMKSDAYGFQGANKHTLDKKGVFGMEGNKQWVTGVKSLLPLPEGMKQAVIAKQNALDGFRAQVKYIESMAKWSELSKAVTDLAKVMSDPAIQESQKNAISMSKEYVRNALGDNPSLVGRNLHAVASAIGESVGVGPSVFNSMIHGVKGGLNTVFFAMNPFFIGANFVQGAMTTPTMVNFLRGRGIDVARFDKLGMTDYMKASMDGLQQIHSPGKDAFTKAMWQYGEDHGISSTQIFDHATDIRKGITHTANTVLEAGMGAAEGIPRSTMFAMFSNILKETGYADHPDIFKVARELTDTAMHDYRAHEGQRINRALGPLAPILGNLSTFSAGANSVIAKMAHEAKTGKGAALAAMMITGLVFHGVMGGSGFDEADKLVEKLSSLMGHPTTLANEVLKLAGQYGGMGDLISTGIGSSLGLDTHAQLGRSSILPTVLGGGSMGAAWDQAKAGWAAITQPSEMNAKRLAYQMSPKILKGAADVTWFTQGDMAMNKKEGHSTEAMYERTPFDTKVKLAGGTSTREFKLKEQIRQQGLEDMHLKDKQKSIVDTLQDKMVTSSGLGEKDISTALDKYIEVEGDPKKFIKDLKQWNVELSVPAMTRYLMNRAKGGSPSAARAIQRLQEKDYGGTE